MGQQNVEVVRRSFEALARGDFDAAFADYAVDSEWCTAADEPDAGTYRGVDELRRMVDALAEPWVDRFGASVQLDGFIPRGDWVCVPWHATLHGRGSGLEVEVFETYAVLVREGKIRRVDEYRTTEQALEVVSSRERGAPMHELTVKGEIKTIAAREGSSGIFTGDIEGLYQGYRFGSTTPDEREYSIDAPHGSIALLLRQQIVTPLPPRPARHPFADGRDPFDDPAAYLAETLGGGGPPTGPPPGAEPPGTQGGKEIFHRVHYMEVKLHVLPDKSAGVFAGASGEGEIFAPKYAMGGHLIVETAHGELRMDFLESGTKEKLTADLWVDGERSTGIWRGAEGELEFTLIVMAPVFGRGPYSGTIRLQQEPPR